MTLAAYLSLRAESIAYSLQVPSTDHPPSLKNPIRVPVPVAQDGWKQGASKEARHKAKQDLMEILRRSLHQAGKPVVSQTAKYPVFPADWT